MNSLGDIFAELGISHYLHDFIEQGFDTWDTILDIKESDFDALGVKLGHRRKLQRRIASFRGLSSDRALDSPGHVPTEELPQDEHKTSGTKPDNKDGGNGGGVQGAKRKYRRHPKQDENAPDRPPSAYVIFSNKMREDLKGRNLSFTEIAKLVGEHWQSLAPSDKEPFEQQAFTAKEKYNTELAEYKKTENYRDYTQYLTEFKARQSNQQPVNDLEISKRPKLEGHLSATSTSTTSSGASMHGVETQRSSRAGSSSNPSQWQAGDEQTPQSSSMSKSSTSFSPPKLRGSPSTPSTTALPGYRESLYGNTQQSLPWRDGPREEGAASLQQFSRMASVGDQRPTYMLMGMGDNRNASELAQHSHRTGHSHAPPPLSTETTNMSSASTGSTSSYFTPQTPMELPSERGLPLPSLYSQHSSGSYENVLPPLQPPSLSPQITMLGSQHSPTTMYPKMDFPSTIAPLRGYGPASQASHPVDTRPRELAKMASKPTDEDLDPVSALLKAGEIVNRSSQGR